MDPLFVETLVAVSNCLCLIGLAWCGERILRG